MPYSDRKPQPKVSPQAKEIEFEICKNCGKLHRFGIKCPNCGLGIEDFEHRWENYKRE